MGIISALFFFIIGGVLAVTAWVFSGISYLIPNDIIEAISWFFLQLNYFRGIFPVETLLRVIGTMFLVWGYLYALKLFMQFILPLVPWIGRHISFPEHNTHGNVASKAVHMRENFRNVMRGPDRIHRG